MVDRLVLALALTLFACGAVVVLMYPPNHDVAWLLHAARSVLNGADLYRDVIEPNPPLIVYLMVPLVGAASLLDVPAMAVFRVTVLVVTGLTLVWSGALLRSALPPAHRYGLGLLLVAGSALLVPLTGFSFGQRDPLVALFLLPYLAAAVARARGVELGPWHAIAVGGFAALGIALKPFAAAVWIGVEGYVAFRRGLGSVRRRENAAILGGGVLYLVLVAVFEPDFFGFAAAAMEAYRAYYPASPAILAVQPTPLFAAGVVAVSLAAPAPPPLRELRRVLTLATLGFLAGVFVQNKGWAYHFVPVQVTGGLLLVTLIIDLLRSRTGVAGARSPEGDPGPGTPRGGVRLAAVVMVVGVALAAAGGWRTARAEMPAFHQASVIDVLEEYGDRGSVMALTVRVPPAFSFILSEASPVRWASRFNVLWPVPALYASTVSRPDRPFPYHLGEWSELEAFLIAAVTHDFRTSRPTLLIVDRVPPPGLPGFDPLAYLLSTSPGFREAFRWYEPLVGIGDYVVYRRTDRSGEG